MKHKIDKIKNWLTNYCETSGCSGFVIGVSGGVDSALTSTLCAHTGKKVVVIGMPIYQETSQLDRSELHMDSLCENFSNVTQDTVDLSETFDAFKRASPNNSDLALANTRSRIRMIALYAAANSSNLLVAGTGNKVEDYGLGFFTKYGDGGVDLSPIADLLKSEVREMAAALGIPKALVNAVPTDGLWGDDRIYEERHARNSHKLELPPVCILE